MKQYVKVFALGFMIDVLYVAWIVAIANELSVFAAFASVAMAVPGILGYMSILENRKMMYPYLAGLFFGTLTGSLLHGIVI